MSALSTLAAAGSLAAIVVSALSLLALHVLSPEYAPSWRMVSEYANGGHKWVLTLTFLTWAAASVLLVLAIAPRAQGGMVWAGLGLLALAALGQAMGGLFDINHRLHGPAAMIGIPALCAACVVLQIALTRAGGVDVPPVWVAHLPWISFALMIATLALFFSGLKAAGIEMSPDAAPLAALPEGVTGLVGWANRAIFLTSYLWVGWVALGLLRPAGTP